MQCLVWRERLKYDITEPAAAATGGRCRGEERRAAKDARISTSM
jgi:hypothetical protein